MNKTRRAAIREIFKQVELLKIAVENLPGADGLKDQVESLCNEEQEYFDNMPESMQDGNKGSNAQEAIDNLSTATDKLDEINDALTTLSDDLQEAMDALDNAGGQ